VRAPRRTQLLASAVALLVVGGLVWLGWVWRHPNAFQAAGGWGVGSEHKDVGETLYVGMSYPQKGRDGETVELRDGRVSIETGAEIADAELLVCTIDPDANVGAIGTAVGESIDEFCTSLEPIDGTELDLTYAPMSQQVLLALTLTAPGVVTVSDIVLSYADGWQRGSQHVGGEIWMTTGKLPKDYYGVG
jgi:hypothetical protein